MVGDTCGTISTGRCPCYTVTSTTNTTTSTMVVTCDHWFTVSGNADVYVHMYSIGVDYGYGYGSRGPRRPLRPRLPPPDYVLPSTPGRRAQLTPWNGRDYMLRRKL